MNSKQCVYLLGLFMTACGGGDPSSASSLEPAKGDQGAAKAKLAAIPTPQEIIARTVGAGARLSSVASAPAARPSIATAAKLTAPISEYVRFPGGKLLHQSCVHALPNGARVTDNGDVVGTNGDVIQHVAPCQYEPILEPHAPTGAHQPDANGNIEYLYGLPDSASWFDGVVTQVTVPPSPSGFLDDQLFLWSGLVADGTANLVIQPVLQYGLPAAACSTGWSNWEMEDYFIDVNNNGFCWEQTAVNPGDTITEYTLAISCPDNSGVNCNWLVAYVYNNTTYYGVTPTVPAKPNDAIFQSLEGYQLGTCNALPSNSGLGFLSEWYQPVPSWNSYDQSTQISVGSYGPIIQNGTNDPTNCAYGVQAAGIGPALLGELEY